MKLKKMYLFWAVLMLLSTAALAQISPKVKDIKRHLSRYKDEVVSIDGFVTQYVEDKAQTTNFYYLKDDWGGLIKVRTSAGRPEVGKKYRVIGPVSIEIKYREPYISEEKREVLEPPVPETGTGTGTTVPAPAATVEPVAPAPTPPVPAPPVWQQPAFLIAAGGVLLLILIIILIIVLTKSKGQSGTAEEDAAIFPDAPAPAQTMEGKTIKMQVPPPGTLKLLPGRLEVVAGDDVVKEIRFYKPKGVARPEITFGRAQGPAYSHVQLKPMTVSSRQAKIVFDGGNVFLINYASTESNPTRINGREMSIEESIPISNGDKIAMGEIEFKFHAN